MKKPETCNTMKTATVSRKLVLGREAIRRLTTRQLDHVAGGTGGQHTCELSCWCRDC